MLSIGKLANTAESKSYHLNQVAKGAEDYYLGSGEAPGRWIGGGARDLGLEGLVSAEPLLRTLEGKDPYTGSSLIRKTKGARVPGFDLTFKAPKSVSLIFGLGDRDLSDQARAAHDAAVDAAVGYLERNAVAGRRVIDGATVDVAGSGFVAAAFRHRTSRAGDPALHTHVLAANLTKGSDGRWGALNGTWLYAHARTAGFLYQAHLRFEMTSRLGVEWTSVHNGYAEVVGIPQPALRAFSRRRAEIEKKMAERGETSARAAQAIALETRKRKDYGVRPQSLIDDWRARGEQLGVTTEVLRSTTGRSTYSLTPQAAQAMVQSLSEPQGGLCQMASTFSRRDAMRGAAERLPQGAPVARVEELVDGYLRSPLVSLPAAPAGQSQLRHGDGIRRQDGREVAAKTDLDRYSTPEMLRTESALVESAASTAQEGRGQARPEDISYALLRRPSLSDEQRNLVRHVTGSKAGVVVVLGSAGAGKTYALDAAREAWELSHRRVIGCALSASAARQLQLGSGIASFTIASLLEDLADPERGGLERDSVLVVDEAGMVGTRTLRLLGDYAAKAGAKLVLIGDDKQLPEIDAGGGFRGLRDRLGAAVLTENRRQREEWHQDALEMIRTGSVEKALLSYQSHEAIVVGAVAEDVRKQLVLDWLQARSGWQGSPAAAADPAAEPLMIAIRKADVVEFNSAARALLVEQGRVDAGGLAIGDVAFAPGDRVMTLRNARGLGVLNGTRGRVEAADVERGELTLRKDDGELVTLPRSYLEAGHLTHAYAIHTAKAQGATVESAFIWADETLYREALYTSMSRARGETRLYYTVGRDALEDEVASGAVVLPERSFADLVRSATRSRGKHMAIDEGFFERKTQAGRDVEAIEDDEISRQDQDRDIER